MGFFGTLIIAFGTLIIAFGTLIIAFGTLIIAFGTLIRLTKNQSINIIYFSISIYLQLEEMMMDEIVIHSNKMNQIPLTGFTKSDLNFFYTLCAKVKDKGTNVVELSFIEIRELAQYPQRNNTMMIDELKRMNKKLLNCSGTIETDNKITQFVLFTVFEIDKDSQMLTVQVNPRFAWMLNNLASEFTMFELAQYVSMSGIYSKNLFRLLKQWKSQGCTKKYEVDELKELLATPDYSPKKLMGEIIKPAIEELKKKKVWSNLWVEIIYKRGRGKPVDGYRFHFSDNTTEGQMTIEDFDMGLEANTEIDKLKNNIDGLTDKDVKKLVKLAEKNNLTIKDLIDIMKYTSEKEVNNFVGYVTKLIKDGWEQPIKTNAKNKFNDFGGKADYDVDEIERLLMIKQLSKI